MAQTGFTPISIYYSSTASATPTSGNLIAGELAINTADGKLFYKDSSGVVQVIAGKGGAGIAAGSNTQVQYNSSGSLAGSANMTFNGNNLSLNDGGLVASYSVNNVNDILALRNPNTGSSASNRVIMGNNLAAFIATLTVNGSNNTSGAGANGFSVFAETGNLSLGAGGTQAIFVQSSNQNISIGNSAPLRTVDITRSTNVGSSDTFPSLGIRNTLATQGNGTTTFNIARLDVQSGNGTVFGAAGTLYDASYSGMFIGTESNHPVRIQTAGTEQVRITNTGNVGVGTTTPLQKFQVNGADAVIRLSDSNGSTSDFGSDSVGTYLRNFSTSAFRFVDSSGTIRMAVDTNNNFQFNSGYGVAATAYGCRAWVNFNGTGTIAIRASGNVSSITDNATGDYTVNFSIAMPDTNYSMAGSGFRSSFGTTRTVAILPVTYATGSIQIYSSQTDSASGSPYDFEFVNVNIFR